MSLYKDASLVMIPSAYKDGKLYSIRPTDGDGDFTFSRGSNLAATRVDVNGLIEKGRENLALQSNNFQSWSQTTAATTTSGQAGYDGSNDAWLVTKSAANGSVRELYTFDGSVTTFSVYAKADTDNWMELFAGGNRVFFDLANGVVGSSSGTIIDSNIESVGGGWYRCSIVQNYNGASTLRIYVSDADGDNSGTSGSIYIQDAQLEKGLVATDYIETGASTAQAGILEDMPRLDYSGGASCPALLLEPQRTNLVPNGDYIEGLISRSGSIVTSNYGTSPEGYQNSTRVQKNTSTDGYQYFTYSVSASTAYTMSVYAKGSGTIRWNFYDGTSAQNSSFLNLTSEWVRYTFSVTSSSSTSSGDFGFYISDDAEVYGFQMEAGSYPTSYIPTYGASVTRSQDDMDTTFNSALTSSGSVSVLFDLGAAPETGSNSTTNNLQFVFSNGDRIIYNQNSVSQHRIELNVNGGTEFIYKTFGLLRSIAAKICVVVTNKTYRIFVNGELTSSVGSFTGTADWTSTDTFDSAITEAIGVIPMKQLVYFPTALTDAEAIALTE